MKFKLKKKEIVLSAIWVAFVVIMLLLSRGSFYNVSQDDYNDGTVDLYEVDLFNNRITQTVSISDKVQKFSFLMSSASETNEIVTISVLSVTDGEVLNSVEKTLVPSSGEEQLVEWKFDKREDFPEEVVIEVTSNIQAAEKIFVCVQEKTYEQNYMENNEVQEAHLRMAVVYNQEYNLLFMCVLAIELLFAGLLFTTDCIKKLPIEKIFLIAVFSGGLAFVFITPFGQEADGWVHFTRSMDVSYGNLLLPFFDNNGNSSIFRLPENISEIAFRIVQPGSRDGIAFTEHLKQYYFSNTLIDIEIVGGFASAFYLPQAVGLFIARMLRFSSYGHMLLGRLVNLSVYATLSYYGLKKMPLYKNIYMVIALLPMTLYQAASFSYDATLNALCFVFIALCFNYAYEKESLDWKDVLKLGLILALLLTCKYVYACIGLLVFVIPMKKFGASKEYWKSFAIALIPVAVMVLYLLRGFMTPSAPATSTDAAEVAEMTQFGYIMSNPFALIKTYIRTIFACFTTYVRQLNILGWLNYSLGNLEFIVPIFMGIVAVLDTNGSKEKVQTKDKLLYFATFVIVVSIGMLGLYLLDTVANPVGASVILGYQGRYTIPVLILLLAMVASRNVTNTIKNFSYKVVGGMGFILSYASIILMQTCY